MCIDVLTYIDLLLVKDALREFRSRTNASVLISEIDVYTILALDIADAL